MIRYALHCADGHRFESWFKSASAFDALLAGGHVTCAVCGSAQVSKALMAPPVMAKDSAAPVKAEAEASAPAPVSQDDRDMAIAQMRAHVEENATYVGGKFAEKACEIHEGIAPDAAIYGEASGAEARALIEDGVPVLPLPFKPKQKLQ
jgi:hypothetical protein